MYLVTQVSGNNWAKIMALRELLEQQQVRVAQLGRQGHQAGFSYFSATGNSGPAVTESNSGIWGVTGDKAASRDKADAQTGQWEDYNERLAFYEAIGNNSFHTLYNEHGIIDAELGLEILYAMAKSKPVILSHLPIFDDDVDTFTQRVIGSRLHNLLVCDLSRAGRAEISAAMRYVSGTAQVDYALNAHDSTIIQAKLRNRLQKSVRTALQRPEGHRNSSKHIPGSAFDLTESITEPLGSPAV